MRPRRSMFGVDLLRPGRRSARALVCLAFSLLGGCAWLGPEIVRSGRPAYNDAILNTSDAQLLQNVVRSRYSDSIGFLNVAAVTSNVTVTASGTLNAGIGPSNNYAGNLVPLAATLGTEQNPTISFVPVSGDHLLRQFAAPVPLERAILLIGSMHEPQLAWRMLVRRINDLRSPDFPEPPAIVTDPRHEEFVTLASHLQRSGSLYWARLAGAQSGFAMVLHGYSPHSTREAKRLLQLAGIRHPEREGDDLVVPVQAALGAPPPNTLVLQTRTVLDLVRIAAAAVELPADSPGAMPVSAPGPAGNGFRIRASGAEQAGARVATQYRGRWFWIADDDLYSKQWFTLMRMVVDSQLPDHSLGGMPTLTIPVAGR